MRESTRRWCAASLSAGVALALSACNGSVGSPGGSAATNVMPPASQAMAVKKKKLSPITIYPGEVVGEPNQFTPPTGDTASGGQGGKVGKVQCNPTEYISDYHIHAYLGIIDKGTQIAVPQAIGLMGPGPAQSGYISTAKCYYWLHTHDASGLIHVEDPKNLPPSTAYYKLSKFLDIWGVKTSATSFGPFSGTMHIFVGNVANLGDTKVSKYTAYTKGIRSIPLRSHEVIWVEMGSPYYKAAKLPSVTFYTEY